MDTVDKATRSRIMSRVRQKNTKPELVFRKELHRRGLRYRLHGRNLPGSPDLVLKAYRTAVFVHGCFWHFHGCRFSSVPSTRRKFWTEKFKANRNRDKKKNRLLLAQGWRVLIVWECTLRGRDGVAVKKAADKAARWIKSSRTKEKLLVVG